MPDFHSIRFQPKRPLLREISAERLNLILQEIKRNKPLPGRGVTVRQTGQGTAIDLAATTGRGSVGPTSAAPRPWDLIASADPENEDQYVITVRPGLLNGILPSNWSIQETASASELMYAKAVISTDGTAITGVSIEIDATPPSEQEPQEFGIESSIDYLFGLFANGQTYRTIGDGNISLLPRVWMTKEKDEPAAAGELPYVVYYLLQ